MGLGWFSRAQDQRGRILEGGCQNRSISKEINISRFRSASLYTLQDVKDPAYPRIGFRR